MLLKFELNHIYTFTTPAGTITPVGKDLINAAITTVDLLKDEWTVLNPDNTRRYFPSLPDVDEWEWVWTVDKNGVEYRGNFPKRVAKWAKKEFGITCPESFLSKIGNLARSHSTETFSYKFDFVDEFDWNDGDFGDSGSCYWGDNEDARYLIQENGFLAVRFFGDDNYGYARAWVKPCEEFHVIFNGYGLTTLEIAKILATWQGLNYKNIRLSNNGESSGLVYINGGGGYIVGLEENLSIYRHDFELYTPSGCNRCGRAVGEYGYEGTDGETYCDECFYEYYDYCGECEDTFNRDDLIYVQNTEREVCQSCLKRHYTYCEYCGEYWHDSRVSEDKEGRAICDSCKEDD